MARDTRFIEKLTRSAHAGIALLRATATRPSVPLKVNFCLTHRCQARCTTCRVWQRTPADELTAAEIASFVRENPRVVWADLTGGEIFLRPDIDEIFDAVMAGWKRLAILHFPTNGLLTDRIVRSVQRLAGRGPGHTIVTVSVDGDQETNDEIRGVPGGFRRQIATFTALRRIAGVTAVLGVTLSAHNLGRLAQTIEACTREVPGLRIDEIHVNVAQASAHYYDNLGAEGVAPDPDRVRAEMRVFRTLRGRARTGPQLLEHAYLRGLERFLRSGITPMPCHALRGSCFVDPHGTVYPCISYSRPIGRLRDTGMALDAIWNAADTRQLQREIWNGQCPQCWTACEAYQTILGNVLACRWRGRDATQSLMRSWPWRVRARGNGSEAGR